MRWLAVVVVGCSASSSTTPRSQPPIVKHETVDRRAALAARAEQALAADTVLDYERPLIAKPDPRSQTLALFADACQAGDARSCRSAAIFSSGDDRAKYLEAVAIHCRAGDVLSCRTLPNDRQDARPIDAPGAAGRSWACHEVSDLSGCDFDAARRECDAGMIASCHVLYGARPSAQASDELHKRIATLSREGCAAGLLHECANQLISTTWTDEQFAIARDRCFKLRVCSFYGHMLSEQKHDLASARDAFEIGCQYSPWALGDCLDLSARYLDGKLAEPVPGRGQALLDQYCRLLLDTFKSRDRVIKSRPQCKRATTL
jgi:hypothetical protein